MSDPRDLDQEPVPERGEPDELVDETGPEAAEAPARRGFYLTPRQAFVSVAAVLAVVLIGLVAYLIWLTWPADYTSKGGTTQAKIVPELVIYGPGSGQAPRFARPMGVAWDRDGKRIHVADTENNRVVVFDSAGRFLFEVGGLGIAKPLPGVKRTWEPGKLNYPTDVDTDDKGNIYVADFYNDSISVFDPKGKFLRRFPDPYTQVGKGSSGQDGGGIAVTALCVADGKVYATDEFQVFVFTTEGKLLRQFGKPGSGPGDLDHPNGLSVNNIGIVHVSDSNHNRVTAYKPDGEHIWTLGSQVSGLMQETDNPFVLPRGQTLLFDGSILVADPLGQVLVEISPDGKVVATYGARGELPGQLNFPNDVSARKDKVVIADRGNDRVQVVRIVGR